MRDPRKVDEYGKLAWKDEKLRLDAFAEELKSEGNPKVYFVISIIGKDTSQIFKKHSEKIEKYLMEKHKISKGRVIINSRVGLDFQLQIWILPIDSRKWCR